MSRLQGEAAERVAEYTALYRYCEDILQQLNAAQRALDEAQVGRGRGMHAWWRLWAMGNVLCGAEAAYEGWSHGPYAAACHDDGRGLQPQCLARMYGAGVTLPHPACMPSHAWWS